jgi:CelD/BcsL family acetyltransferase involved in cellulose biosynthesis
MNHTIRSAIEDGMSEYRLLRGDEGYKSRFATRDDGLQTRMLAGTPLGRVAAAALASAARRPRTRERLKHLDR